MEKSVIFERLERFNVLFDIEGCCQRKKVVGMSQKSVRFDHPYSIRRNVFFGELIQLLVESEFNTS
jgi:hypothetical protein